MCNAVMVRRFGGRAKDDDLAPKTHAMLAIESHKGISNGLDPFVRPAAVVRFIA